MRVCAQKSTNESSHDQKETADTSRYAGTDFVSHPTGNRRKSNRKNRRADKQQSHERRRQIQNVLQVEGQNETDHGLCKTHQKKTDAAQSKHSYSKQGQV